MSYALEQRDVAAVSRVMTLLLSPLTFDHPDHWRHAVNAAVRDLLGADSAGFLLPTLPVQPMYSAEHPADNMRAFPELQPPDLADGTPIWMVGLRNAVSSMSSAYGAELPRYVRSAYYNEFAAPNGAAFTATLAAPLHSVDTTSAAPVSLLGVTALQIWRDSGSREFDERALTLLSLLAPALRSGVDALRRQFQGQAQLASMLDAHGIPILLVARDGAVAHQSEAYRRLLSQDADGQSLADAVRVFAAGARRTMNKPASADGRSGGAACESHARTRAGTYTLRATVAPLQQFGESALLVTVTPLFPPPASDEALRVRFGLTATEIRVTRALAAGASNANIAEQFAISIHTARRHVESVLRKLGVRSRAAVAPRILDG